MDVVQGYAAPTLSRRDRLDQIVAVADSTDGRGWSGAEKTGK